MIVGCKMGNLNSTNKFFSYYKYEAVLASQILARLKEEAQQESHSDSESDDSPEEHSPKWTPFPPPNMNYILRRSLRLLDVDLSEDSVWDASSSNANVGMDVSGSDAGEHASVVAEQVSTGTEVPGEDPFPLDDFDCSFEDEQKMDALVQQEVGSDENISASSLHHSKPQSVAPTLSSSRELPSSSMTDSTNVGSMCKQVSSMETATADSSVSSGDEFNASFEDEQFIDTLVLQGMDAVPTDHVEPPPSPSLHPSSPAHAHGSTSNKDPSPSSPKDMVLTSHSPPATDIYEIDDEFDFSQEDYNQIDEDVELYIKQSPDSSSTDEDLPPVQWTKQSPPTHKLSTTHKNKTQWVPVGSHSSSAYSSSTTGAHFSTKKESNSGRDYLQGIQSSSVAGGHSGTVRDVQSHPSTSSQAVARASGASASGLAIKRCSVCFFEFPERYSCVSSACYFRAQA